MERTPIKQHRDLKKLLKSLSENFHSLVQIGNIEVDLLAVQLFIYFQFIFIIEAGLNPFISLVDIIHILLCVTNHFVLVISVTWHITPQVASAILNHQTKMVLSRRCNILMFWWLCVVIFRISWQIAELHSENGLKEYPNPCGCHLSCVPWGI